MATETLAFKGNGGSSSLILTSGASGRINALFSLRLLKSLLMLINAAVLLLLLPFRGRRRVLAVEKPAKDEKQQDCHRKGAVVRLPAAIVPWKSSINVSSSTAVTVKAVDEAVAARRALAIRRVMEDSDQSTAREYSLIDTKRGDKIFTQSWTPVSVKIR